MTPHLCTDSLVPRASRARAKGVPRAALGALLGLVSASCGLGKPGPDLHYYSLSLPVPQTAAPEHRPSLMLRRFAARDPFGQEALVYRSSAYRVNFYGYHRWIAPPANMVSEWTLRYLRGAGVFSQVSEYSGDLLLSAIIRDFTEMDGADTWSASLSIDFIMSRTKDAAPVFMRAYSATQRAVRRNPEAVAEAMSRNLQQVLEQLTADLQPVAAQLAPSDVAQPAPIGTR